MIPDARSFATGPNFELILRQTAVVGIAALGMTLVIISGGIDLSVGSIMSLSTVAIAQLLVRRTTPPPWRPRAASSAGSRAGCSSGCSSRA